MPEFAAVKIAFDDEAGLYWINEHDGPYAHLVAEARSINSLQKKIAKLLDTSPSHVELRLPLVSPSSRAMRRKPGR
jgi:hypothetical protein